MPATHFICPDGEHVPIEECLKSSCRIGNDFPAGRCLSIRTLRFIAEQREWKGIPSTTMLLKGTRENFLEIVTDFAINPQDALFRVHGTKSHALLDKYVEGDELGEERIWDKICSGQFDFYDPETETLFDTKTWGSYKINKALGMYQKDVPVLDESGNEVIYKSGKKKGEVKTRKEWLEGGVKHRLNEAIQLNDYRIKLEKELPEGYKVKNMVIEALARDGNTFSAKQRGIELNGVLIPVNKISDHWIKTYLNKKRHLLLYALDNLELPPKCKPRECWHGRKCSRFCNVRSNCNMLEKGIPLKELLRSDWNVSKQSVC